MKAILLGQRFGRLTVLKDGVEEDARVRRCRCDCGREIEVRVDHLMSGASRSCGCLRRELHTKHGKTKTPEYRAWLNMKKRCYFTKDTSYQRYGGRGIRVCDAWLHSFEQFLSDLGCKPGPEYSLDRIDPDRDYAPDNCRWATRVTQSQNQSSATDSPTGVRGVRLNKRGGYEVNITHDGAWRRVGTYKTLEAAVAARKAAEERFWGGDAK